MDTNTILGLVALVAVVGWSWLSMLRKGKNKGLIKEILDQGALVIDVRTASECASGMFPGARNIPLDKLPSQAKKLGSTETPIVVYCASGNRSTQAAGILRNAGYTKVYNAGGLGDMPR